MWKNVVLKDKRECNVADEDVQEKSNFINVIFNLIKKYILLQTDIKIL